MDTTYLEKQIEVKDQEIADKQAKIERLKEGIIIDKKLRKVMVDGLERLKEKYPKDANPEQKEG